MTKPVVHTIDSMPPGDYALQIMDVIEEDGRLFMCGVITSGPHEGEPFRLQVGGVIV